MLTTIILSLSGLILLLLAATVVYSNYRNAANRWLGTFIVAGSLWLIANLFANLSVHDPQAYLFYSRSALIGSCLVPYAFLMFCLKFTGKRSSRKLVLSLALPVIILLALTPTKLNIQSVSANSNTITPGPAYIGLFVLIVAYFFLGIRLLVHEYRRASNVRRQQLYYILLGTVFTVVPGLIFSGILPLLGYSDAVSLSPVVVLFFSIFTSVAIIQHRLFDIRLVIARALGYAGSLIILAAFYGLLAFGVARVFFDVELSLAAQIYLSLVTGMAAISFPYFKNGFDKVTTKIFYRDAYDAQELYGELNKILVSSLDVKYLMLQSISVIQTALKPDYALIGLRDGETSQRIFASKKVEFSREDIATLRGLTLKVHHKVIVTDFLDAPNERVLRELLQKNKVAVLVRLTQNVRGGEEGFGYLALGVKKSGNPYTTQDMRVLDTVGNELIIAIQNALHYEEIQRFNIELQGRVDEATRKLRRNNEKLKALDETKDDFISMASHQLRTPLTSVKGYLSMVLEGDAGDINETQRKMLGQAYTSSQRMVYLIADLLNVSRLRTGKFVIDAGPTDLSLMIDEEIGQLTEAAASRSLELSYKKPDSFPTLMLDETKTRQVLMNFIDNAIYYTPKGGHIQIVLEDTGPTVEFRVIDDGIGVPKSEQHHLFTKFYRAGNARQARPDGTGLGLFMAKKVISAQNGALIFDSKEGKGSTFGFTFAKSKLQDMPTNTAKS